MSCLKPIQPVQESYVSTVGMGRGEWESCQTDTTLEHQYLFKSSERLLHRWFQLTPCPTWPHKLNAPVKSKESGPIASDCFQTLWDFGIRGNLIIFLITLGEYYSWKCTIWKILMKMWLYGYHYWLYTVRYNNIGNCKMGSLVFYPNGLTTLTEIWNQDFLGDETSCE